MKAQASEFLAKTQSASAPLAEDHELSAARVLELAQKTHSICLTRNDAERGQLIKTVLLNCRTDGVSFWPTYRKPFDMIFERAKSQEWRGRRDSNLSRFGGVSEARAARRSPERREGPLSRVIDCPSVGTLSRVYSQWIRAATKRPSHTPKLSDIHSGLV